MTVCRRGRLLLLWLFDRRLDRALSTTNAEDDTTTLPPTNMMYLDKQNEK